MSGSLRSTSDLAVCAQRQSDSSSLGRLEQGGEVLRNVCNTAIERLFVGCSPRTAGEVLSEKTDFFGSQKAVNLHATKAILESLMPALLLLTAMGELFKQLDEAIVNALSVVVGDATVWSHELQQVAKS